MTYRPTEFEVDNHAGIALEIRLNPECPMDEGGNVWFEVSQDSASIVANLGALEMLVDAANELLAGWREKIRLARLSVPTEASSGATGQDEHEPGAMNAQPAGEQP